MNVTALEVFEEFRFILELVAAEFLFILPFAQKRVHARFRIAIGFFALLAASQFYFGVRLFHEKNAGIPRVLLFWGWYMFMVFLSILYMFFCFRLKKCDLIFMTVSAYAAQHIEYVLVNEIVALGVWTQITEKLWLYVLLCAVTCVLLYRGLYLLFAAGLKENEDGLLKESAANFWIYGIMLAVLVSSSFVGQHIFRFSMDGPNYYSAALDVLICILILVVQYSVFHNSQLFQEQRILEQLLYERQKQYEMSKDTVNLVNHKCHDLKNQMLALKEMSVLEQTEFFRDIDQTVQIYDMTAATENEVLNTLLTEKSFYCERNGISLTYIVDGEKVSFMKTLDIYALIGNALDNAIECVGLYDDPDKRMVSLNISSRNQFVCIQVTNYFEGALTMEDGVPVTSKEDKRYHGYGIKSMRMIAQKYKGTMEIASEQNMFILEIVIPIPQAA